MIDDIIKLKTLMNYFAIIHVNTPEIVSEDVAFSFFVKYLNIYSKIDLSCTDKFQIRYNNVIFKILGGLIHSLQKREDGRKLLDNKIEYSDKSVNIMDALNYLRLEKNRLCHYNFHSEYNEAILLGIMQKIQLKR